MRLVLFILVLVAVSAAAAPAHSPSFRAQSLTTNAAGVPVVGEVPIWNGTLWDPGTIHGAELWTNDGVFLRPFSLPRVGVTNLIGFSSSFFSNTVIVSLNTNKIVALTNGSITAMFTTNSPGSFVRVDGGARGGGWFSLSTNCNIELSEAAYAGGWFTRCNDCAVNAIGGGSASAEMWDSSVNCTVSGGPGGRSQAYIFDCDFCRALSDIGGFSAGNFDTSTNCVIDAQNGGWGGFKCFNSSNLRLFSRGGFAAVSALGATNGTWEIRDGSILSSYVIGTLTTGWVQHGSIASGVLGDNERFYAAGGTVGALAMGRDITSTNNWTFGIHYTNNLPFSLALGVDGVTQFRATSNGNLTIKGLDYTMPSAHAVGALTNDGSGTLGWFSLASLSGQTPWLSDINAATFSLTNFGQLVFTNGSTITPREGTNVLALRNGTVPQEVRIYTTFTDTSNYERGFFRRNPSSFAFQIGTESAGSGTARDLLLTAGTARDVYLATCARTGSGDTLFIPQTDNARDLGHPSFRWRDLLLSDELKFGSGDTVLMAGSVGTLFIKTNTIIQGSLTVTQQTRFPSGAIQTVAAGTAITNNATKVRVAGSGGAVTSTATPTMTTNNVIDGNLVYVMGTDDTNTWTAQDAGSLAGSALQLGAASRALGKGDILVLMWDQTDGVFYEVSFANN